MQLGVSARHSSGEGVSAARLQNSRSFCVRRAAGSKLGLLRCLPSIHLPAHPRSQGGDTGSGCELRRALQNELVRGEKKPGRILWSENSSQEGAKCDLHLVTTNTQRLGERRGATIARNAQGSRRDPSYRGPVGISAWEKGRVKC